jgi:hypothetical protein
MKTVDELFESDEFTFGSLMESVSWNAEAAYEYLNDFINKNRYTGSFPSLRQVDGGGDQPEVWDGGFLLDKNEQGRMILVYVGADGPSGGSGKTVQRVVHADDVIEII